MKISLKIKFLIILINLLLIICGVFFIHSHIKDKQSKCIDIDVAKKQQQHQNISIFNDLAICKNDLFLAKKKVERLKAAPDIRKDIISLLILMREFEKKIGVIEDFSDYCIKMFTLSERIPMIHDYMSIFKKKMFKNGCNFSNNETIMNTIKPIRDDINSALAQKYIMNNGNNGNNIDKNNMSFLKKSYFNIKNCFVKLFVKNKIKENDLEIAIKYSNYDCALKIMNDNKLDKNEKYNQLYNSIKELQELQQMINDANEIISNINR